MKRVLSLVLAVVLAFGLTTVAFAATADTAAGHYRLGESGKTFTTGGFTLSPHDFKQGDDEELKIYIEYSKDGTNFANVKKGNSLALDVTLNKKTGSAVIDSASIDYDTNGAYISFNLMEDYATTKDVDYKAIMFLTSDGKRVKDSDGTMEVTVEGTWSNIEQKVDADSDKAWIDDGKYIKADEYNSNLEVVLNDDISLLARVFSGKKYYANLSDEPNEAAVAIMDKNASIVNYAKFDTIGLSSSQVKFNYSDNLYAYTTDAEGNLVYVGRTNENLPYYTEYYLSNKEITLETTEPEGEPAPADGEGTDTAEGGGDDVAPTATNNFNPGTGR